MKAPNSLRGPEAPGAPPVRCARRILFGPARKPWTPRRRVCWSRLGLCLGGPLHPAFGPGED